MHARLDQVLRIGRVLFRALADFLAHVAHLDAGRRFRQTLLHQQRLDFRDARLHQRRGHVGRRVEGTDVEIDLAQIRRDEAVGRARGVDEGVGRQIAGQGGDGQAGEHDGQQAAFEHGDSSTVKVHEVSVKMSNITMD
ncbi:hypothetical protein D3C72_1621130 [compost metagenome]